MIQASWIYASVVILLSFIEAIRFKTQWGKVVNIDHRVSVNLAIYAGSATMCLWIVLNCKQGEWRWMYLVNFALIGLAMVAIRLALYDPLLNLFRIFMKINPTGRLDYVSTETNSYEDQHSEKLIFWEKRAVGIGAWLVLVFVYFLIFHTL